MRIEELQLRAYGPFTDLDLVFDKRDGDFHMLYGRNEAGKSSALRALKALLFGIPQQSTDNFLHEYTKLRVGGRIRNADGEDLFLMRRKGTKNTLLDINEKPVDETALNRFLQGVTEGVFEAFFGIGHESLAQGAQTILREGGEVGQSLFSAAVGGVNLKAVLQDFDSEADMLFRPRGQLQTINKAINEYAGLKKAVTEASLSSRKWLDHKEQIAKNLKDRDDLSKRIDSLRREKSRLRRLQQTLPDLAKRAKLINELHGLGDVVIVDDDFGTKRRELMEQLRTARETKERSAHEVEQLRQGMARIIIPEGILDQGETISDLHQRLGSHRKGLQDLGRLQGNIQQLKLDIDVLVSEIKAGATAQDCLGMRPNAALRAKVQDLGGRYQALLDALNRSDRDIRKSEGELKAAVEELQSFDTPQDVDALKSALLRAHKQGDLLLGLEEARGRLEAEEEQIALDLKRLPLWSQGIAGLEEVSIPSPETVDRFESVFHEITTQLMSLDEKEKEGRADLAATELKIEALRMAGSVPTEGELFRARERRDLGWSLVLRSWIGNETVTEEAGVFDPENDLPRAYEKTVLNADDVADRLRREADRVAQHANLVAQQGAIGQNLAYLAEARKRLDLQLAEADREWDEHWKATGMKPLSPKEMRAWAAKRDALLQRADRSKDLRRIYESILRQIEQHRAALMDRLDDLGRKAGTDPAFDVLMTHCESVVAAIEAVNRSRADLNTKIKDLKDRSQSLHQNHEDLKKERELWQDHWKITVAKLGLEADTSPPEAYAVLAKLDDLFKKVDETASLERRVFGIKRDSENFSTAVKGLVERVAADLHNLPIEQAVTQLNASLSKANTDYARLADMKNRLDEQGKMLHEAEEMTKMTLNRLGSLCIDARCETYEDLEEIERKSSLSKALGEKIDAAEVRLLEAGGGMSIEEVVEETKGVDADALPGMISETERQLEALEAERSELDQRLGGMRAILAQMDGSARAAETAEEAQQVLASMREKVDRYVRLRMCSMILTGEIERYRSQNQGPIIGRASRLFSDLTLQSFSGLTTDFNERDEPVIVGIRPTGEKIGVSGMSDGTRDQLYLALRVAGLEKYVDANEPMPFIVDDILIRFDDERAAAALNILADLSRKTQVLFLTHHARLVDLAGKESACGNPVIHLL